CQAVPRKNGPFSGVFAKFFLARAFCGTFSWYNGPLITLITQRVGARNLRTARTYGKCPQVLFAGTMVC
ncbi:MAG: hypothetical protein LBK61_06060, partial [Spirochaetaceae bacterium]|nr:hypothetical protein [Spirochaetaceae bacterium]